MHTMHYTAVCTLSNATWYIDSLVACSSSSQWAGIQAGLACICSPLFFSSLVGAGAALRVYFITEATQNTHSFKMYIWSIWSKYVCWHIHSLPHECTNPPGTVGRLHTKWPEWVPRYQGSDNHMTEWASNDTSNQCSGGIHIRMYVCMYVVYKYCMQYTEGCNQL